MTDDQAISLLTACQPLAERLIVPPTTGKAPAYNLTKEDLEILEGFDRVQSDPIAAGPGLFNKLVKAAGLSQVEVYKLEQLSRLVYKHRYGIKIASPSHRPQTG
ncbi:MAG: hypothetical protein JWP00_2752 [Chloroflexi bacterium]|jgi:hypothetical protein|nr:hypothetical protein [Chloroflexota bacterium]